MCVCVCVCVCDSSLLRLSLLLVPSANVLALMRMYARMRAVAAVRELAGPAGGASTAYSRDALAYTSCCHCKFALVRAKILANSEFRIVGGVGTGGTDTHRDRTAV